MLHTRRLNFIEALINEQTTASEDISVLRLSGKSSFSTRRESIDRRRDFLDCGRRFLKIGSIVLGTAR